LLKESLRISWNSLLNKKVRLALTVLGIAIGVAAIVGLMSIGYGLESAIVEQMEDFGADMVMVFGGSFQSAAAGGGASMNTNDLDEINDLKNVKQASAMAMEILPTKFKDEVVTTYLVGIEGDDMAEFFEDMQAVEFDQGSFFDSGDKNVAVIGSIVASGMYEKDVKLRQEIEIKGVSLKVVGILKSIGNPQDDSQIMVPLETYQDVTGKEDEFNYVMVKVTDADKAESVSEDILEYLDDEYGEGTFSAFTSEQIIEQVGQIIGVISITLIGIASIALLVAGVGIANTMYMSVVERTREIGVMKAIGATNKHILQMFLIESLIIGLIGGVVGVILGSGLAYGISYYAQSAGLGILQAAVTPELVISGIAFAVVASVVAGILPARKAAKKNPVDALRYE